MKDMKRTRSLIFLSVAMLLILTACKPLERIEASTEDGHIKGESSVHSSQEAKTEQNQVSSGGNSPAVQQTGETSISSSPVTRAYWPTKDWLTTDPEKQGMDSNQLLNVKEHIKQNSNSIHCLLVTCHGYIVFEE